MHSHCSVDCAALDTVGVRLLSDSLTQQELYLFSLSGCLIHCGMYTQSMPSLYQELNLFSLSGGTPAV